MEIIKTYSKTGYVMDPLVLGGIAANNCGLAVFSSPSEAEGLDRANVVKNFRAASDYRDDKEYSILMDDDIILGRGAIAHLLEGLKGHDAATLPVNGERTRIQHAVIAIKNSALDKYRIEFFNKTFCNQCIYLARLIDKFNVKVNALAGPVQKSVKRSILKKD